MNSLSREYNDKGSQRRLRGGVCAQTPVSVHFGHAYYDKTSNTLVQPLREISRLTGRPRAGEPAILGFLSRRGLHDGHMYGDNGSYALIRR